MATFMQRGNILVVLGSDIHTTPDDDYRLHLRTFLYSDAARRSPVRRGTHNFWVTHAEPSLGSGEHAHEDMRVRPHRMCGMVRMGSVPGDSSAETIKDHIHTVLQEVGHHWLVPADLGMRVDAGRRVPLPSGFSITRSINDETPFAGPPLLGRDDVHWTSYFQADALHGRHELHPAARGRSPLRVATASVHGPQGETFRARSIESHWRLQRPRPDNHGGVGKRGRLHVDRRALPLAGAGLGRPDELSCRIDRRLFRERFPVFRFLPRPPKITR